MPIALPTPYVDTRAADLRWEWGREPLPALAVRDVECPFGRIQMRLLGASHQVRGEVAGVGFSELVACAPSGGARPLPATEERRLHRVSYRFTARVDVLDEVTFRHRSGALAELRQDDALVGVFPGDAGALTALLWTVGDSGLAWQTWHTYPQTREVVRTDTRVDVT
ncbi:MAG: DUF2617 family protein [Actinomycetota bacterium]|nr:DUF2617 family protein [Actinomycetota bacterium]